MSVVTAKNLRSAAELVPHLWSRSMADHVLDVQWSGCAQFLATLPIQGPLLVLNRAGETVAELPEHSGGNGSLAWHPKRPALVTFGQDAELRLYEAPFTGEPRRFALERGWAERMGWNHEGSRLAAAVGKVVHILDAELGGIEHTFPPQKSTIADLAWNPQMPNQIATVCDGGARMWRVGEATPFGKFDWGGASVLVTWSPDGRWVVTGDQQPSVHLYDVKRRHPLHIQGYETKVKAMAWRADGSWLATGGGPFITVWPCTGKNGPEGAHPKQLQGHLSDAVAMAFSTRHPILISGGRDGQVLLWMPDESESAALVAQSEAEITCLRWSPQDDSVAYGTSDGGVTLLQVAR